MGKFKRYIRKLEGKKVNTLNVGQLLEIRQGGEDSFQKTVGVLTRINADSYTILVGPIWGETNPNNVGMWEAICRDGYLNSYGYSVYLAGTDNLLTHSD